MITLLYIADILIGTAIVYSLLRAFRLNLVSKARQKAREVVFSAPSGEYFTMSEAYHAAGTYDQQIWQLSKWTYEDFYPELIKEQK